MNTQQLLAYFKWLGFNLGLLAGAAIVALIAHAIVIYVLRRFSRRTASVFDDEAISSCAVPTRWLLVLAGIWMVLDVSTFAVGTVEFVRHLDSVALVALCAWLTIRVVHVVRDALLSRYNVTVADNLRARAVQTQIRVLERIVISVVVIICIGCALMTFSGVRQLGVSLLASAGIVGIILGLAAQKVLGALLAGLQLALTQPIRLEDVVIVEGEWGTVEEITLTYAVIRIWDLRRLVVPMSYFLEKPFQNWTRTTANLLGTVMIYVDCTAPVEAIREQLHELLKGSPAWDGKAWGLQVTDTDNRTMQLRALMSAADSSSLWDLRCLIRERLLDFIRSTHPTALPRLRIQDTPHVGAGTAADAPETTG
jgi:small-conductance mechanosensitive channel